MNEERGRRNYRLKIRDIKSHHTFVCPLKEIAYDEYDTVHCLINLDSFIVAKTDASNKEELLSYLKKTYSDDIIKLSENYKKNKKTIQLLKETLNKIDGLNDDYEFYLAYKYGRFERTVDVVYKNNDILDAMINEFYNKSRYNCYDHDATKNDIKNSDFFRTYFNHVLKALVNNCNLTKYILSHESKKGEPFYRSIFTYVLTYPMSTEKSSDHYSNMTAREDFYDRLSEYRKLRDFQCMIDAYDDYAKEGILDEFRETTLSDYIKYHSSIKIEYKDRIDCINYDNGEPDMDELYSLFDLDDLDNLEKLNYRVKKR